ncbi:WbqC family protein [candidate division KSB1 bacterium]|nr:WbqC family protein [candidate division KSB1 bacterium]
MLSRIAAADVVVWANTFHYKKHSTINRTRIKTISGPRWLSIPVLTRGASKQIIADMRIDPEHDWQGAHIRSLQSNYQSSPYYYFFADEIADVINKKWRLLDELLQQSTSFLCQKLGFLARFVDSRELPGVTDRSHRVIAWAEACGCSSYLVPTEDERFIDRQFIEKNNCSVLCFDFRSVAYHQLFGDFIGELSGLDLLFNEGEMSRFILQSAQRARKERTA